jgi:hypothetical protein
MSIEVALVRVSRACHGASLLFLISLSVSLQQRAVVIPSGELRIRMSRLGCSAKLCSVNAVGVESRRIVKASE